MNGENFLEINDLVKSYGKHPVIRNVNLSLDKGKIIGLCGENGAGKTTIIKMIVGLLKDYSGEIRIDGMPIGPESKLRISYQPDRLVLPKTLTGIKAAQLYSDFYPDFDPLRLEELFVKMKLDGSMPIAKMSKGMVEKFQLALTLSRKADIYIFDEPIAGVDPASRDSILETILGSYAQNSLLIISTHLIQDIESVLDEVIFVKGGEIYLHRNCDELRESEGKTIDELFREVYKW